ncbi:hypothetical protein PI125_g22217 [Phytophthora idaei]|nr:hypothetical protein PI125_g22217 [Phytophthora idaei]
MGFSRILLILCVAVAAWGTGKVVVGLAGRRADEAVAKAAGAVVGT